MILFKMKAWLDLRQKKASGIHVNARDLTKHKNDVFRLFQLVDPSESITLSPSVKADVAQFMREIRNDAVDLRNLGLEGMSTEEVLISLERLYGKSEILVAP